MAKINDLIPALRAGKTIYRPSRHYVEDDNIGYDADGWFFRAGRLGYNGTVRCPTSFSLKELECDDWEIMPPVANKQ